MRLVQRFVHHELRVCGAAVVRRLLDGEKHHGPPVGRTALVELRGRRGRLALGVRVTQGESHIYIYIYSICAFAGIVFEIGLIDLPPPGTGFNIG